MSIKSKLCMLLTASAIAGCGEDRAETTGVASQATPSTSQTQPPIVVQQTSNNTAVDALIGGAVGGMMGSVIGNSLNNKPAVVEKHYVQTPPAPRYIPRAPSTTYRSISSRGR